MLKPFHLIAALPFVVAACGSYQAQFLPKNCPTDSAERVQAADWAKAKTIIIRVRRDEFTPMVISLTQGRPYEIRLINTGRKKHFFRAPEFFKAIAIESATVGGREVTEACPDLLVLEANETAEIRFVAVRDGHYDFKDTEHPISLGGGAIGVIAIEFREAFTLGSLNPVVIDVPEPAETPAPMAPMEKAPSGNPFDTYEPSPAPEAAPNPFDSYEPSPALDEAPNPFDAVEPAPNPFEAVEPEPALEEEPNPFEAVEPEPALEEEASPFEAAEPTPAEADAPGPMVQAMPPGASAPAPELEDDPDPFAALEPDRLLPLE